MSKVLLPIKPQYAYPILAGLKGYEFRRKIWKDRNAKAVVVYATAPVKRVIGWFEVDTVLCATLDNLWSSTHHKAGIRHKDFMKYFKGMRTGYAIVVGATCLYKKPLELSELGVKAPPQNFIYLP